MKPQAIRNSEIKSRRLKLIALFAIVLFALITSTGYAKETAVKPAFSNLKAFQLKADDQKLTGARFGWCFPTPKDGVQCQTVNGTSVTDLGPGEDDAQANSNELGDGSVVFSVTLLPETAVKEMKAIYDYTWSH